MDDAVIVAAVRTPLGRLGGQLAAVRPDDLAAHVLTSLLDRSTLEPGDIDEIYMGCANQAGEDNRNVARMAGLLAGFPVEVPGVTVNRLCGSGLEAIAQAARAVMAGHAEVVVGAGVESMSRAPWIMPKPDRGYPTGSLELHDSSLGWRLVNPRMDAIGHTEALGITAENLADQYAISRHEQDDFAALSHRKALAAVASGRLREEIAPIQVDAGRKLGTVSVEADEGPRPATTPETLAKLAPAFKTDGSVTAGNSSPLTDGAAAVLLTARSYAERRGLQIIATVDTVATAGVSPRIMGIGPVPATNIALGRANLTLDDMDLIELNEAFAAQSLAVLREWGIAADDPRLNVNGGAIALGHPLGCSGARLVTTIVHEFGHRTEARHALAAMCIGVGQGIAMVLRAERG